MGESWLEKALYALLLGSTRFPTYDCNSNISPASSWQITSWIIKT